MRKWIYGLTGLAVILLLAGCQGSEDDTTTLTVAKDGTIRLHTVSDFPQNLYHLDELTEMIRAEEESYNAGAGSEAVSLKSAKTEEEKVYVDMDFTDASAYSKFEGVLFFDGTIDQALEADYGLEISLRDTAGGENVGKEELLAMPQRRILISEENFRVRLPGRILYVSDGVTPAESGSEADIAGDALHYIVYE